MYYEEEKKFKECSRAKVDEFFKQQEQRAEQDMRCFEPPSQESLEET